MKSTKFVVTRILHLGASGASLSKPTSGAQMYKDYCAACHGTEGRGDAPPWPAAMGVRDGTKSPGAISGSCAVTGSRDFNPAGCRHGELP
jgi:hypothetical protein